MLCLQLYRMDIFGPAISATNAFRLSSCLIAVRLNLHYRLALIPPLVTSRLRHLVMVPPTENHLRNTLRFQVAPCTRKLVRL